MYNPAEYWEKRLAKNFTFRGVGHQSFSLFYNQWLYRRKRQVLRRIFSDVSLQNKTVLDVGTGTGFFLDWYAARGAGLSGVDISPTAIRNLHVRFPQVALHLLDFSDAPINLGATFDIVNVWDVLYHQTDDQHFLQFLQNCAAACCPGGRLILTDGLGFNSPIQVAEHVKFRDLKTYEHNLSALGFQLQGHYPLYRYLNRAARPGRLSRYWYNALAPLLFLLDGRQSQAASDNLSVGVWINKLPENKH